MTDITRLLSENAGALPQEAQEFVRMLIEGQVKQFIVVAELNEGLMFDQIEFLDDDADRFRMLGGIESVKRDYMREVIESRVEYALNTNDE